LWAKFITTESILLRCLRYRRTWEQSLKRSFKLSFALLFSRLWRYYKHWKRKIPQDFLFQILAMGNATHVFINLHLRKKHFFFVFVKASLHSRSFFFF
jgi:hypothetical protein